MAKLTKIAILVGLALSGIVALTAVPNQSVQAAAGINPQINFQGRLLNNQGATVADGYYNIEFKIYQDGDGCVSSGSSPCGGTLKWTGDWVYGTGGANDHRVQVKNGYFSVLLGSVNAFGSSVDFNSDTLFLSINVGNTSTAANFGAASGDGEMLPFKRLAANPYAMNAGKLQGLDKTQFVQLAQGVQADSSAVSSVFINKTNGTGNLVELQSSGTDAFTVSNAGDLAFGENANHTLSVTTRTSNVAGRDLTVQAGTAGAGATGVAGGKLVLQGGNAAGTTGNANGGDAYVFGGSKVNSGTDGNVLLAVNASNTAVGKVGIGTNSPSATLDVNGTINANNVISNTYSGTNSALSVTQSGNPGASQALILANNSNASPSGNLLDLQAGGVSKFSVASSGSVLASGAGDTRYNAKTSGTTAGTYTGYQLSDGSGAFKGGLLIQNSNKNLVGLWGSTAVPIVTVSNFGFVGIGNSAFSAASVLDLSGYKPGTVAGSGTTATQTLSVAGGAGGDTSGTGTTAGTGSLVSLTSGAGGTSSGGTNVIGGTGGALTITSGAGGASTGTAANSNGGSLTLQGGAAGTGGSGTAGSYGNVLLQTSGGNVGVGNSTPRYPLDVVAGTGSQIRVGTASADSGGYLISNGANQLDVQAGSAWNGSNEVAKSTSATIISQNAGTIKLFTNTGLTSGNTYTPTERLRVNSSGIAINASADATADLSFGSNANRSINVITPTTSNAAGTNLTISASAANGSTTGNVGGVLALQGGAAAGTGNNNGGNITLDGGTATGTGTKGNILLQGSGGNVGIGLSSTPAALLSIGGTTGNLTVDSSGNTVTSGTVQYGNDTADTNTLVCRNSTGKLAACNSGSLTGTAFIQGGNSFTAAGDLGTNDNFALNLRTNGSTKLTVTTGGDLTFAQGANRTLSVAANSTANGAGYNLTVAAGNADGTVAGNAGGGLALQGGNAAGAGNNNGGNVTLNGGSKTGTGSIGNVVLQSGGGNVGIGTSTPGYQLDLRNVTGSQIHLINGSGDNGGYLYGAANAQIYIMGGVAFNGTNWIAKATTAAMFDTSGGSFGFFSDSGLTVGNSYTPTSRLSVDASGNLSLGATSAAVAASSTATSTGSTNSGSITLQSGNATGATSNSGNVNVDAGSATGTAGTINIGGTNSPTINVGKSSGTSNSAINYYGNSAFSNLQPGAVSGAGTNATQVLGVTGAKGGNTNGGTATAGTGATVNLTSGAGGDAVSGSTNGNGGNGGTLTIQGGAGGAAIGTGTTGSRGNVSLQASGGNVGIGTSNPAYLLDIRNTSNVSQLHLTTSGNDDGAYLLGLASNGFYAGGGASLNGANWIAKSTIASILDENLNGQLEFWSNSGLTVGNAYTPTRRLLLDATGNLTLGTASASISVGSVPTSTASSNSGGITLQSGNATGATSNSGSVTIDAGTATGTAGTVNIGTANSPIINIGKNSGTSNDSLNYYGNSSISNLQPAAVSGAGTAAAQVLGVTGAKGGNTNGGTATAGTGATVNLTSGAGGDAVSGSTNGNGGNGGTLTIQGGAGGAAIGTGTVGSYGNISLQASGGSVGIGTSTPGSKLDLLSPNDGIRILSGSSSSFPYFAMGRTAADADFGISVSNNGFFDGSVAGDFSVRALSGKLGLTTANSGSANTKDILVKTGGVTGGSGLSTGAITIQTGNGSGTNTSSGNVTIDSGAKTGTGTNGSVSIGTSNASSVSLGRSGITTTSNGALTVTEALSASSTLTVTGASALNGNATIQGTQPTAVSGAGTAAAQVLGVTGAKGGNTNGGTATAGTGATANLTSGAGGDAVSGSTNGNGGNGGTITIQGGAGGAGIGSGAAGNYGNIILQSSGGSVGIGTSGTPSQLLSVGGTTGNFTVSSAGAVLAVGVSSGTGLLQGTGGLTVTGTASINGSGSSNTTIGNSGGGTITIGATSGSDLVLQDAQWSVTGAGAANFATVNGLTVTAASDGFTVAGGTTSRTLTVTGADITIGSTIKPTSAGAISIQANGANAVNIANGTSATAVNIGNTTSNPSIALSGSGTFGTTTGANSLNGNTTVASGKSFTVAGGASSLTADSASVALTIQGTQPTAVSGAGTAAAQVLGVTGAKGGNTNGGTATAGAGASVNLTSGAGGDAVSGSTNGNGGAGGDITIQGGAGGAAIGTGTAGSYGNLLLQSSGGNIQLGNTTSAIAQTINIGNNATASSTDTINIGNLNGSSTTTLQGGSGNINLITNQTGAGITVKTATNNSTTAFQVQNSGGNRIFGVDTANSQVLLGKSSSVDGTLQFKNSSSSNAITINSTAANANYTLTLPSSAPSPGLCLETSSASASQLIFASCSNINSSITEVNSWDANNTNAITISPSQVGDEVVLMTQIPTGGVSVSSISGGGVSTWTKAASNAGNGTVNRVEMWIGTVTSAGSSTATVTYSSSPGVEELVATEFTAAGVNSATSWGIDSSGSQLNSTASTTVTYPNLKAVNGSELYVGYGQVQNPPATAGSTTGFNYIVTSTQHNAVTYDVSTTANTFYQPTANQNSSGQSNTVGVILTAFVSSTAINNTTTLQQANFYVQAASGGSVAGVLQAASSGTADILELRSAGAANVLSVGNTGAAVFKNSSNSSSAFQVQNNSGNSILGVDTSANQVLLGTSSVLSGKLTFNDSGDTNQISLAAPSSVAASYTLTLPSNTPTAGLCLGTSPSNATQLIFASCATQVSAAAITYVNQWSNSGTSITTLTDSPASVGNLLTLYSHGTNNVNITGISGGGVTNWTKVTSNVGGAGQGNNEMWRGVVTSTGSGTITVTYSAAAGANEITAQEFTMGGSGGTWAIDTSGTTTGSSTTINYPSLTPANSSELYAGYAWGANTMSAGSTSGYTYVATNSSKYTVRNPSVTGGSAQQPTATQSVSGNYNSIAALIQAYAGTSVIVNSTASQQANFAVQAATAGTVAGVLQGASSGSADIFQAQDSSGHNILSANATNGVTLGTSNSVGGSLTFAASGNSNTISINAPSAPGSSYTLTLPTTTPAAGQCIATSPSNANQLVFSSCANQVTSVAISYVNSWKANGNGITTLSTSAANLGDLVVFFASPHNSPSVSSVSGGGVTGWTKVTSSTGGSGSDTSSIDMWRGVVTTTGSSTITVTYSGPNGNPSELAAMEFTTGSNTGSWVVDSSAVQINATGTTVTYPSLTPQSSKDLYVGYSAASSAQSAGSTSGFTYLSGSLTSRDGLYNTSVSATTQPTSTQTTSGASIAIGALVAAYSSSSVIANSDITQQGNFNVQAATSGSVAGTLQAYPTGTGHIMDLLDGQGNLVGSHDSTGNATIKPSTGSASALRVQTTGGVNVLSVDTSGLKVVVGAGATGEATPSLLVVDSQTGSSSDPTEVNGGMYYNATSHSFRCGVDGSWQTCTGLLYSNSSNSSANNNCSNNCAAYGTNAPVPANYCQTGRVIKLLASGYFSSQSSASNLQFGVYYGTDSSTAANDTLIGALAPTASVTSASNNYFQINFNIVCFSTSSMQGSGTASIQTGSSNSGMTVLPMTSTSATTVSSSTAKNLYIFPIWDTATTSNTSTVTQFVVNSY